MDYNVMRRHEGDRLYEPGDTRQADAEDVKHLVDNGVLVPVTEAAEAVQADSVEKAEKAAPKNKAEPAAPKNKAAD